MIPRPTPLSLYYLMVIVSSMNSYAFRRHTASNYSFIPPLVLIPKVVATKGSEVISLDHIHIFADRARNQ